MTLPPVPASAPLSFLPKAQGELGLSVELSPEVALAEIEDREGRWPDLSRLERRRPDALRAAVKFLGLDVLSRREICEWLRLSPCTLQAICEHPVYGAAVVSDREGLSRDGRRFVQLQLRLWLRESVDHVGEDGKWRPARKADLWQVMQVAEQVSKWEGGLPAVRHEHVHVHVQSQVDRELMEWIKAGGMREAMAGAPGMGLEGGNVSPMAAPGGAAVVAGAMADGAADGQGAVMEAEVVSGGASDGIAEGEALGMRGMRRGVANVMSKEGQNGGTMAGAALGLEDAGSGAGSGTDQGAGLGEFSTGGGEGVSGSRPPGSP